MKYNDYLKKFINIDLKDIFPLALLSKAIIILQISGLKPDRKYTKNEINKIYTNICYNISKLKLTIPRYMKKLNEAKIMSAFLGVLRKFET